MNVQNLFLPDAGNFESTINYIILIVFFSNKKVTSRYHRKRITAVRLILKLENLT